MISARIFSDTPRSFFAMLARPSGELYLDALDAIEEAQRRRQEGGLSREELLDLCQRVLDAHEATGNAPVEEGVGVGTEESNRPKLTAAAMIREMLAIEWLEEPHRNDYRRLFYLDSRAELLLEGLRRIAYPEQVAFTDKLHLVCTRLTDPKAFTDHPLSDLESCLDNARYGLQELRALQQGVARLTQRQLKSDSLRENLRVLYDDFAANIGQRCYRQLVALKLPIRLPLARQALEQIVATPATRDKMLLELTQRRPDLTGGELERQLTAQIQDLFDLLNAVEPQAEAVDRRAADFARRSFARFRYLQEVSSGRREQVREFFERINSEYQGERLSELETRLRIPDLRLPEASLLSGLESLAFPREKRESYEPSAIEELADWESQDDALNEIGENINQSLNVRRANRFFETLDFPSDQAAFISADLEMDPYLPKEWMTDLVALLLHAEVTEATYRLQSPREEGIDPPLDAIGTHWIDRFELTRR